MAIQRFRALEQANSHMPVEVEAPSLKTSDYFGENTFSLKTMRQYLPAEVFKSLINCIEHNEPINEVIADVAANAMKTWAMNKGVTHHTHWFQPLTGTTAEKHDSFLDITADGSPIEKFRGSALIRQEPDASSFPSGGLRQTFEARGYTAWDPTSPAFIVESGKTKTLCVPTVFVSYNGEALDNKAPLLRALDRVDKAATEVCQYFDRDITKVIATLGCEQEFFLIDRSLAEVRPDLMLTGRALYGRKPPKGQQLEDHYFGSIPARVQAFLHEFEIECYKLGIPVTTRHNEVAPAQFEIAPLFEEANIANDHNQMIMDLMEKVSRKHNFKVLLHEKPFAGLNGSGKHNNWSLSTNTGKNLLAPTSRAKENLMFLTFFVNTIKAVYEHADLLRASIATAGNDHRLGANEAPPAIMSIFIGDQLNSVLNELEHNGDVKIDKGDNVYMKLGIDKIPPILLDNTDRNRTSPFAFTGNKFEFRAVGSSSNNAFPLTVLNTIVADQLIDFKNKVDAQLEKDVKKEVAIINVLRDYIKSSKHILFEGNGYGDEWVEEATKVRGLKNVKDTPRALDFIVSDSAMEVFTKQQVLSEIELHARHEVMLENYILKLQIESRIMADLAKNHVIPTAILYQNRLIENAKGLKELGLLKEDDEILTNIQILSKHINLVSQLSYQMTKERKRINAMEETREKAIAYCDEVKAKYFEELRWHVDKLETMIDDQLWPMPKLRELLFTK